MPPAGRWQPDHYTIPRTALTPMASYVRQMLGREIEAIDQAIAGRTNADHDLIVRLGHTLWPKAARLLAEAQIPAALESTGLREDVFRPLVRITAALLEQAAPLHAMCTETAHGQMPPNPETVTRMLSRAGSVSPMALSMLIEQMLVRLPHAVVSIQPRYRGPEATAIHLALDQAADRLLGKLGQEDATEGLVAAGTLADASGATGRIMALLDQLRAGTGRAPRREAIQAIRRRLDASCRTRFAAELQDDFLNPLQHLGTAVDPASVTELETTARSLRMLEIEARAVGSQAAYDLLLGKAVQAVKSEVMRDKLTRVEQIRLVEILAGPDAALEMLDQGPDVSRRPRSG